MTVSHVDHMEIIYAKHKVRSQSPCGQDHRGRVTHARRLLKYQVVYHALAIAGDEYSCSVYSAHFEMAS
jgi:hypothetical protein